MKDLTHYPADLAGMTVAQLVSLPIRDFMESEGHVDEAIAYLKQLRTKLDVAKLQRFGEQARAVLRDSGRDFGTTHVNITIAAVGQALTEQDLALAHAIGALATTAVPVGA